MSSINRHSHTPIFTHGGTIAQKINPEMQLRRSVLSCLLWENEFYEDGQSIAQRIVEYANKCDPRIVASLAIEARNIHGLRHVPLILLLNLIARKDVDQKTLSVRKTIEQTIRRPDELTELLALYWQKGKIPLDKQLQRGLADAFVKFNEYSLAKYNRDGPIKLRDVMFMCRPKPRNEEQAVLLKKVADKKLQTPDTWEVELSAGKDKKETFERLIRENKLGYLALLRNLRNMFQSGCDNKLVSEAILARRGAEFTFPFRYVAAARAAPIYEKFLDQALCASINEKKPLEGTTIVLVDVSGSMNSQLSDRSDLTRMDAAAALASIINSEFTRTFSFSERTIEIPSRKGMAGIDAIVESQRHSSTKLAEAINYANTQKHDRLIVITDEQATSSFTKIPSPVAKYAYMINVASYQHGVGYRDWIHIDGFSEAILKYIHVFEEMK